MGWRRQDIIGVAVVLIEDEGKTDTLIPFLPASWVKIKTDLQDYVKSLKEER